MGLGNQNLDGHTWCFIYCARICIQQYSCQSSAFLHMVQGLSCVLSYLSVSSLPRALWYIAQYCAYMAIHLLSRNKAQIRGPYFQSMKVRLSTALHNIIFSYCTILDYTILYYVLLHTTCYMHHFGSDSAATGGNHPELYMTLGGEEPPNVSRDGQKGSGMEGAFVAILLFSVVSCIVCCI